MNRLCAVGGTLRCRLNAQLVRLSAAQESAFTASGAVMETLTAKMAVMRETAVSGLVLGWQFLIDFLFIYFLYSVFTKT